MKLEGWLPPPAGPIKSAAQAVYLNAGDLLSIQVNATSGKGINFSVNAVRILYTNQIPNKFLTTYLFYPDVTKVNKDWIVPLTSWYDFVFNSSNSFTYEDVTLLVTKRWTETAYRDVTQNYQLLPFEFAYFGVVLALVGIGLTIYGVVKKRDENILSSFFVLVTPTFPIAKTIIAEPKELIRVVKRWLTKHSK